MAKKARIVSSITLCEPIFMFFVTDFFASKNYCSDYTFFGWGLTGSTLGTEDSRDI